ncbi:hypothetical protein WDW89_05315 [Deltaproteobacteria bacterium TL4]
MKFTSILNKALLIVFGIMLVSSSAYAEGKSPLQIQLAATTVGPGLHAGYHINDVIFLGLEATSTSISQSSTDAAGTVEATLDFSTQVVMLRVSPFKGSFFLQGGVVNRSWTVEASGTSLIGDSGEEGVLAVKVDFPSPAFNVGLGWNWIADFGLSGGLGFGVISGGNPTVDMEAAGVYSVIPDEEIQKEEDDFADSMSAFATFPYVHINIGWNF